MLHLVFKRGVKIGGEMRSYGKLSATHLSQLMALFLEAKPKGVYRANGNKIFIKAMYPVSK
jgi:hypothetical protein